MEPQNRPLKCIPVTVDPDRKNSALNALKHGACAVKTLILETESYADFLALEARWFKSYQVDPAGPAAEQAEAGLIRAAVRAEWFYLRAERNYAEVEATMTNQTVDLLIWSDDHHFVLTRFLRYRTANANLLTKARKAIDDFRKARAQELLQAERLRHEHRKLILTRCRIQVHRTKHQPRPPSDQRPPVAESVKPPDPSL